MSSKIQTIRPLCPELQEKANCELHETPKKLEHGLQHLKEWISKQPHLNARSDDQWLVAYLRGCKYNIERAKQKLELYYSLRVIMPELFSFRPKHSAFKECLKSGALLILPKLSKPVDPRVIIIRAKLYDPKLGSAVEFLSFFHAMHQIFYYEDDAFVVNGAIVIADIQGAKISHFTELTPILLKNVILLNQDACPVRFRGAHVINSLPFFEIIFNLAKKLVNKKNRERFFIHSKKGEGLYKHVPKKIMPVEYGGNGGTAQEITDYWVKKVDEYAPWLDDNEMLGTDKLLSLRRAKAADTTYGIQGTFRRLEVD